LDIYENKTLFIILNLFYYNESLSKRQRIPMGLSKIDNPEKLATYEEKHNKNTTQYVVGHPVYANKHK
jgi:hypothetical protein